MSGNTVISVKNISKHYVIGAKKDGSLAGTLTNLFKSSSSKKDKFHALKDVSFDISKGEVLGIVGKNGAGKSTLLKILSQITRPSKGSVELNGRIASLLEVGTGFHPELTGRENIFLNGTILGMTRKEVKNKFDEIVEFSGVQKFIDTPVKHYSSGMYVRLAFSVAAHLEPEILIIDEVLAVGDAEFQRKCLGKMKDVSQKGRTVIFVSHNMEAIKSLCTRAILITEGQIADDGDPEIITKKYLSLNNTLKLSTDWTYENSIGNELIKIKHASILPDNENEDSLITVRDELTIRIDFWLEEDDLALNLSLHLFAGAGECIFAALTGLPAKKLKKGLHSGVCIIPRDFLNTGPYSISCLFVQDETKAIYTFVDHLNFEVVENRDRGMWHGNFPGFIRPKLDFKIKTE
ncbi:MAG: ABC transporter ATP-binding protein [Crocinitomicaceae bacterium]|nr:ABC transporter ATP-binding protein [Crocinitomicaceae bacterium]